MKGSIMKKLSVAALMLLLLMAYPAAAQDEEDEEHDVIEIGFMGGLGIPAGGITDWTDGQNSLNAQTGWSLGLDVGYFVTPSFVTGFNFTYQQLNVDNDEAGSTFHRLYNPNLYAKYIFPSETNLEPYVKVHVGVENAKFTTFVKNSNQDRFRAISYDPAFAFGFSIGTFYFTSDYSGLFFDVQYHRALTNNVGATYADFDYQFRKNLTTWNLNIGIRVLVGSEG